MKKITKIFALSFTALTLVACNDIVAQPKQVLDGDVLVTFKTNGVDIYSNNFKVIYNHLVDSGTSNSSIIEDLTKMIAEPEVTATYGLGKGDFTKVFANVKAVMAKKDSEKAEYTNADAANVLEEALVKQIKDDLLNKAKGGSYDVDSLFQEEKLVNELNTSLYNVKHIGDTPYTKDLLITPELEFDDVLKADYSEYVEKKVFPDLYKQLLTSAYLYSFNYSSLGRSYARNAKYIKISSLTDHLESASILINKYFDAFLGNQASGEPAITNFSLDDLASIYKGVGVTGEAEAFLNYYNKGATKAFYTKDDVITEEIAKFAELGADGKYVINKNDDMRDDSLLSSYTGSHTYSIAHGKELKERELAKENLVVDDDLVIKSGGLSDLPDELRNRLFSSSVNNNFETIGTGEKAVKIITPKTTINYGDASAVDKYCYYDSSASAYYICVLEEVVTSASLADKEDATVKSKALEISRILGKTSTNQKAALIYYLDKYDLEFGDQDFYDYIESTYPDVLDDNYSYNK